MGVESDALMKRIVIFVFPAKTIWYSFHSQQDGQAREVSSDGRDRNVDVQPFFSRT